jgi:hypothetical protein
MLTTLPWNCVLEAIEYDSAPSPRGVAACGTAQPRQGWLVYLAICAVNHPMPSLIVPEEQSYITESKISIYMETDTARSK